MKRFLAIGAAAAAVLLAAFARVAEPPSPAGTADRAAPAVVVEAALPVRRDVPVGLRAGGSVTPLRIVELRSRLGSTIRQVHVAEGQFVRAGDPMFSLDDRGERAGIAQARAQVARDAALVAELERQHGRNRDLLATGFIAHSAADAVRSQLQVARAALAAGQASLEAAVVQAGHGSLRAPMPGRVGAVDLHPGSLVQPSTTLTTITQLHPIAVTFTLPESALPDLLAAQERGPVPVTVTPAGGPVPVAGTLRFLDAAVDRTTGSIRAKAWFDNPDTRLWPGQYVQVRLTTRVLRDAWVIPQAALVTRPDGTFVYTIGTDGRASLVPVRRLHADGSEVAVEGIDGRAPIVTAGIQNLRPGMPVARAAAGIHKGATP